MCTAMLNQGELAEAASHLQPKQTNSVDQLHLVVRLGESLQPDRCDAQHDYNEMRREIRHLEATIKAMTALLIADELNNKPAL